MLRVGSHFLSELEIDPGTYSKMILDKSVKKHTLKTEWPLNGAGKLDRQKTKMRVLSLMLYKNHLKMNQMPKPGI